MKYIFWHLRMLSSFESLNKSTLYFIQCRKYIKMAEDRLDFLVFGATGFTGKHCIPYLLKFTKKDGRNLTWGVSGRSKEKLEEVLSTKGSKLGEDLSKIPIVVADVKSDESLLKMAQKTKIVINCCGPFRFLGEPVVKACIEAGTHYIDVSGEPQFIESVELNYQKVASEKGIYIVSACGWDSVPNDLGLVFTESKFGGTLNSVVSYIELWEKGGRTHGPSINYGTWESIVYGLAHAKELTDLRRKLNKEKLPSFKPKLKLKTLPHRPELINGWSFPFPGADRSVMKRTQKYFYENWNKRPVQVDTQFTVKSFVALVAIVVSFLVWSLLVKFKLGRSLLLNYPHIFTGGMFRKDESPSEENIENTEFQVTFYGEGWKEKQENRDDQYSSPPNRCIVTRVKGTNPGYGATCLCAVGAAFVIATEVDKLPKKGGVYTPGSAFAKTSYVDILHENGLTFEVLSEKEIN